jgi:hypothetical protein
MSIRLAFWIAHLFGVGWVVYFVAKGDYSWAGAFAVVTLGSMTLCLLPKRRAA